MEQTSSQQHFERTYRMGTALRLNKKQILFLLFVLLALLVIAVMALHAATPHLFHSVAFAPKFFYRH